MGGSRDEGFWSRALLFYRGAEGDAPSGPSEGLHGTAPTEHRTNAGKWAKTCTGSDSWRNSEEAFSAQSA